MEGLQLNSNTKTNKVLYYVMVVNHCNNKTVIDLRLFSWSLSVGAVYYKNALMTSLKYTTPFLNRARDFDRRGINAGVWAHLWQ